MLVIHLQILCSLRKYVDLLGVSVLEIWQNLNGLLRVKEVSELLTSPSSVAETLKYFSFGFFLVMS